MSRVRKAARDPSRIPRVVLPNQLALRSFQRRLAQAGGALGAQVGTFDSLYEEIRAGAEEVSLILTEPVQKQIIRGAAAAVSLEHYQAVEDSPGFIEVLHDLIRELKAGGITPPEFQHAAGELGEGPRLEELAAVYQRYQRVLEEGGFQDYLGAGWSARGCLEAQPELAADWPLLVIDGFDDFNPVQVQIIRLLAERVEEMVITLTGEEAERERGMVLHRFRRTRRILEDVLDVRAQALPGGRQGSRIHATFHTLERGLFTTLEEQREEAGALKLTAAPDRAGEVRAALRWLKQKIVEEGIKVRNCGLLARNLEPYRPFLVRTAREFGLPLAVQGGHPLAENPAVAAVLNLLRLGVPGEGYLAWQGVVEAWRSPYFDWTPVWGEMEDKAGLDSGPEEADTLAWIARWGSVISGEEQWREAFAVLAGMETRPGPWDEEYPEVPDDLPIGAEAAALGARFERFVNFLQPPPGRRSLREFIRWLENRLESAEEDGPDPGLSVVDRLEKGEGELKVRDHRALRAFKDILRGLAWGERAAGREPVPYARFVQELEGALTGASYQPQEFPAGGALLALDVVQARGIPFQAAAVLGLAEGEFPAPASEDPFLRDGDRDRLREEHGLPLRRSTESAEAGYFYETITRASERLLLTRPRIAENGAPWQPSPFWEEVRRRVKVIPHRLTSQHRPAPGDCASWPELWETAAGEDGAALWAWASGQQPDLAERIDRVRLIVRERTRDRGTSVGIYDGGLGAVVGIFQELYRPEHIWSSSRLETYRTCPYFFFTAHVLDLEPYQPPREGLDARQLGNIYHRILELLYRAAGENAALDILLELLPEVAEEILDEAPRVEGFRETAWWEETRRNILENLKRSLEVIETLDPEYGFYRSEQDFGISSRGGPPLTVSGSRGDYFRLRGFIDRVDRTEDGRVRVVDYKTSSPYAFTRYALRRGKKLQLALYALAAERALDLGKVGDGFYFHVRQAETSGLRLASFSVEGSRGPEAAMDHGARMAWEAVRGARRGAFVPRAPDDGCPSYCPAAAYCWQYDPVYW